MTLPASSRLEPDALRPSTPQARGYYCPGCRRASLQPTFQVPDVARCQRCGWATEDLLRLVPTRAEPLASLALGRGAAGVARAGLFLLGLAALVALVLAGR